MVKEKPRQHKAELESFKSLTHRVRDLVQENKALDEFVLEFFKVIPIFVRHILLLLIFRYILFVF